MHPIALSQALSEALIAFTIEVDNTWEHRFWRLADPKPLRTSLVMWANFLRFVGPDGVTLRSLSRNAGYPAQRAHPDLAGMLRWRYVTAEPGSGKRPSKMDQVLRPSAVGEAAAAAWAPLPGEFEARWVERFGAAEIQALRGALFALIRRIDRPLPHYYSVLDHKKGMRTLDPVAPDCDPVEGLALPFLLSQVSQQYALDFEREADVSLALQANVIRVLTNDPIAKRELPQRSGISKEALSMGINHLKKHGFIAEGPIATGRGKAVRLTPLGRALQAQYSGALARVEEDWAHAYSAECVNALREALAVIVERRDRLFEGLTPYPEGWRASLKPIEVLPHHPMVLYRGGWPDGS